MKKRAHVMALFSNFDEAFAAVAEIRYYRIPGLTVDDVNVISPIEHPEIEEFLGERESHVPKFTLMGALFGMSFGFFFLCTAQANFLVQPQGGKPVVPLPSNIVLTYEMLILFGVIATLIGFALGAQLFKKRDSLYSESVSLDQVAIELHVDEKYMEPLKQLFTEHKALEIREAVA